MYLSFKPYIILNSIYIYIYVYVCIYIYIYIYMYILFMSSIVVKFIPQGLAYILIVFLRGTHVNPYIFVTSRAS